MFKSLPNQLQVSMGLFVGYCIAISISVLFSEKTWQEAFEKNFHLLVVSLAGILLSLYFFKRSQKNVNTEEEE